MRGKKETILPKYSFEKELPEGWYLSRVCNSKTEKRYRILYYKNVLAARVIDTFSLEHTIRDIINNPPECVQEVLYYDGKLPIDKLSIEVVKSLFKKDEISRETAEKLFPELEPWLSSIRPQYAEYAGNVYTHADKFWYDESGNCINDMYKFRTIWDARVSYAEGKSSLADIARYSWSAVLECLGDEHQRYIDTVIKPKLVVNQKAWVCDAKFKKEERLYKNRNWEHTEFDMTEEIEDEYLIAINSCLNKYFYESKANHVQMFTEVCNLKAFDNIKSDTERYEADVTEVLKSIHPELGGFKWNSLLNSYEPVFAPKPMTAEKRQEFFDLMHSVIIGEMSGHEAALRFTNQHWAKIAKESKRYEKHLTQYVPFYNDRWKKLNVSNFSFGSVVSYVKRSIKDLIRLGFRDESKSVTAFNYDSLRFTVDVNTNEVCYAGLAGGDYLSDKWLALKPEVRRQILNDDAEWEYQEKAIKKFNKLFSYLYNVVHKHWDRVQFYKEDKLKAKKKYLRPSTKFFARMQEKADKYINSLERGVAVC